MFSKLQKPVQKKNVIIPSSTNFNRSMKPFCIIRSTIQIKKNITITRGAMAKSIAFFQQSSFPDSIAGRFSELQIWIISSHLEYVRWHTDQSLFRRLAS